VRTDQTMTMEWKILKSDYLFKDLWFTVRRDTCERPDGKVITPYYVYEFPEWVTAVAMTREGEFIMERQYRHAAGLTMTEIPGGCVDASDMNFEEAIARELKEETGYVFDRFEYLGKTSANPSTNSNWMHMYLATGGVKAGDQEMDDNEEIEVRLIGMEELKQLLRDRQILQSMHATALFYALERLGAINF